MSHHIEPRSVGNYLSGICNKLEVFYPDVRAARNSPLVTKTLKGCKRLRSKPVHRKLPLSRAHLARAEEDISPSSSHDDFLFVSMLDSGFGGLMRLGELTMPDNPTLRDSSKYIRRASVSWEVDGYGFVLPFHKADRTFEGNRIMIIDRPAFAVRAHFKRYLKSRDRLFPIHPFLWVTSSGNVPTCRWFLTRFRALEPDRSFAGQSLRAGGATALAEEGTPPELIQASGRWASSTFQIYVRKNPMVLNAMLTGRRAARV